MDEWGRPCELHKISLKPKLINIMVTNAAAKRVARALTAIKCVRVLYEGGD